MDFLKRVRRQPEHVRKIILWSIVIIIGLGLLVWWIHSSYWKIKEFPKEEFIEKLNLPSLEKELPEIEMPQVHKELQEGME